MTDTMRKDNETLRSELTDSIESRLRDVYEQARARAHLSKIGFSHILEAAGKGAGLALLLSACKPLDVTPTRPTQDATDSHTATYEQPTPTQLVPAGSDSTEVPENPNVRIQVSAEMATNVEPSLLIGSGEAQVSEYPINSSEGMRGAIDACYTAIQKNYPGTRVFFNQDTALGGTGQWIVYGITQDGKLIQHIVQYPGTGGGRQYGDYPIVFDLNTQEVVGEYELVDIPGGTLGVIWDLGLPQLLVDEIEVDGVRYFTKAMNYSVLYPDNPWTEIDGIMEVFEDTVAPEIIGSYMISSGDTLESIAASHGITLGELLMVQPVNDRIAWYRINRDNGTLPADKLIGVSLNIPSPATEAWNLRFGDELFNSAPELMGYTKIKDDENRYVYYQNANGEIDRVYDPELGEIMGYSISEGGVVIFTSQQILSESGLLTPTIGGPGDIDDAIGLWKKHNIENGNPFLLTDNTNIEVEFRRSGADPIMRPKDTLGDPTLGGSWIYWTRNGNLRIVIYDSSIINEQYNRYEASGAFIWFLIYSIPENMGPNRPAATRGWHLPDAGETGYDLRIASYGDPGLAGNYEPCPITFEEPYQH